MSFLVKLNYEEERCFTAKFSTKNFTNIASVKDYFKMRDCVAKHNGKLMKDESPIPQTTQNNPLHLLQNICKACHDILLHYILISGICMCKIYTEIDKPDSIVHKKFKKYGSPTQRISEILLKISIKSEKNKILLYKGKNISLATELHDLETTENDELLMVVCTIGKLQ